MYQFLYNVDPQRGCWYSSEIYAKSVKRHICHLKNMVNGRVRCLTVSRWLFFTKLCIRVRENKPLAKIDKLTVWLCFFGIKTAYATASPAPPAYADHMTVDG